MSDGFVPLNPGNGDIPPRGGDFINLGGGGNGANGRADSRSDSHRPGDADEPEDGAKPNVILHRDGDTIVSIEIECPCGQHVVLSCDYSDGSAN